MSAVAFEVRNATTLLLPPSIGLRRPLRVAPPKQHSVLASGPGGRLAEG